LQCSGQKAHNLIPYRVYSQLAFPRVRGGQTLLIPSYLPSSQVSAQTFMLHPHARSSSDSTSAQPESWSHTSSCRLGWPAATYEYQECPVIASVCDIVRECLEYFRLQQIYVPHNKYTGSFFHWLSHNWQSIYVKFKIFGHLNYSLFESDCGRLVRNMLKVDASPPRISFETFRLVATQPYCSHLRLMSPEE
jgi:hypothetical protein